MKKNIKSWQDRAKEAGRFPCFSGDEVAPFVMAENTELRAYNAELEARTLLPCTINTAQDSRAAFEKAMNDARFFPAELSFAFTKSPSGRDEYANSHLESCWTGWQAYAAFIAQHAHANTEDAEGPYAQIDAHLANLTDFSFSAVDPATLALANEAVAVLRAAQQTPTEISEIDAVELPEKPNGNLPQNIWAIYYTGEQMDSHATKAVLKDRANRKVMK